MEAGVILIGFLILMLISVLDNMSAHDKACNCNTCRHHRETRRQLRRRGIQ